MLLGNRPGKEGWLCVDVPVTLSSRLESAVLVTLVGLMRE